jgi:predicted lipoprotein with Yx(FWY)xxD motif
MKKKLTFSVFLVFALAMTACASSTPTPTSVVATQPPATMAPATMVPPNTPEGPSTVDVGQNSSLGSILVDSNGMTLYLFTNDSNNTSTCFDTCATKWPPLLTNGAPIPGTGVTASLLGTFTRPDGTVQVTYNGHPLYYFAKDTAAGDTNGEGVGSIWYVVTPDGNQK